MYILLLVLDDANVIGFYKQNNAAISLLKCYLIILNSFSTGDTILFLTLITERFSYSAPKYCTTLC